MLNHPFKGFANISSPPIKKSCGPGMAVNGITANFEILRQPRCIRPVNPLLFNSSPADAGKSNTVPSWRPALAGSFCLALPLVI
jgi:hypothetical protein